MEGRRRIFPQKHAISRSFCLWLVGGTSRSQHLAKEFKWVVGEKTSKRLVVPSDALKDRFADAYSTLEKVGHVEGLFAAFDLTGAEPHV